MTWSVRVDFDPDKTDVGNVSATFDYGDDKPYEYSKRWQASAGVVGAIRAEINAGKADWDAKRAAEATAETAIGTGLT